ncbi:fimbrillin family protein [Phocaeicola sartorii]|uniref:fimbrillin family protein n=1 Tax=Phocaeicola sartorii TaxID=671267 RepID=UPI0035112B42
MKAKSVMIMAAATMILAGCSNDENETADSWNGEIRLASGVTVQTRANTQATQIQSGETVYVWADKTLSATDYIKAWALTADGSNGFTDPSTPQYYPTDGSTLNFYALHGNFAPGAFTEESTAFPTSAIVHSVEADQSGTDTKAYAKSDLLYAVQKNVARSRHAIQLPFYHMLSKVEVVLKAGNGKPDLTGAVVTIVGTKLKADFTPDKTKDIADVSSGQGHRAGMITITGSDNNATPITIRTVTTTDFNSNAEYGEAVVLPKQTLNEGDAFIQVKLSNDAVFTYKIPAGETLTLESGKKYTYKITVNQTGLTVTSKIEDWAEVKKEGDAVMD